MLDRARSLLKHKFVQLTVVGLVLYSFYNILTLFKSIPCARQKNLRETEDFIVEGKFRHNVRSC